MIYCSDTVVSTKVFGSILNSVFDGIVEQGGELYLYDNGTTTTCGLFEVDGKYYYSYWGGLLRTDGRYYATRTYCDLPVGNYTFGPDGAMLDGIVEQEGKSYFYDKGTVVTAGLYEKNGAYYYVDWDGTLMTDGRYYVPRTYCDLPIGNYSFGKDGKMIDGFVVIDEIKYYYKNV